MDNLKMHSLNKVDENVDKIGKLFPNTLTETIKDYNKDGSPIIESAIDFDMLKQELSSVVVEGREERYQFTWPDKKKSILLANAPIAKTLRPCREESVDFDTTENLYIEGDNLDVLKLVQETYLHRIKMIYIDPPYNTGNDAFVYDDDSSISATEFSDKSGQYDEDGNMLFDLRSNNEANGRFHTDWLNMIYPRLKIAKDLLTDDGVIFISIGEEEINSLINICNEVYGESNKISIISRVSKTASNMGNFFAPSTDYILCYSKNINCTLPFKGDVDTALYKKVEIDGERKGEYYRDDIAFFQSGLKHGGSRYPIKCPDGSLINTPDNKPWRANEATFLSWVEKGLIVFRETKTSPLIDELTGGRANWNIYTKSYLNDRQISGTQPRNFLTEFINRKGADLIKTYGIPFDFAKPVELLVFLIKLINDKNSIIIDFFSGSATTAHAVMQQNAEDGGNRKFIMVQLPEETDENSEAYKAGYKNICEIGKERIRRAGKKIKEAAGLTAQNLDTGFRVLKVDSTNMKDVYYNPSEYTQAMLDGLQNNIKNDRTPEDLLFQVMLDLGVILSSDIKETKICGKNVFSVMDNYLIACFDNNATEDVVTEIAKLQPYYAVFRDSSIATDSVATNFEQIFETYSKTTIRKVL